MIEGFCCECGAALPPTEAAASRVIFRYRNETLYYYVCANCWKADSLSRVEKRFLELRRRLEEREKKEVKSGAEVGE